MINKKDYTRIKYLTIKAWKGNLKSPEFILIYMHQQGHEKITEKDIVDVMNDCRLIYH